MQTLYTLTERYLNLLEAAQAMPTPLEEEQDPIHPLTRAIAQLDDEIETKADGYCKVIRSLEAEAKAYRTEQERMAKIATARENSAKHLKATLLESLQMLKKDVVQGQTFKVSVGKSNPAVTIVNEDDIPDGLKEKETIVQVTVNKKGIVELWKQGQETPGASVNQGQFLRIHP